MQEKIAKLVDQKMDHLCKSVWANNWEDTNYYQNYLAQTYYYVFHSCRLLALAAAGTRVGDSQFYRRCISHLAEESGHDSMALVDLKRLGGKIENFKQLGSTKALWECQYYKILYDGPKSLLGYILALELVAVRAMPEVYSRVKKVHGEKASQFLRVHVEEDPSHVDDAIKQISFLSDIDQQKVLDNYEQSCEMYGHFLLSCDLNMGWEQSALVVRSEQGVIDQPFLL